MHNDLRVFFFITKFNLLIHLYISRCSYGLKLHIFFSDNNKIILLTTLSLSNYNKFEKSMISVCFNLKFFVNMSVARMYLELNSSFSEIV